LLFFFTAELLLLTTVIFLYNSSILLLRSSLLSFMIILVDSLSLLKFLFLSLEKLLNKLLLSYNIEFLSSLLWLPFCLILVNWILSSNLNDSDLFRFICIRLLVELGYIWWGSASCLNLNVILLLLLRWTFDLLGNLDLLFLSVTVVLNSLNLWRAFENAFMSFVCRFSLVNFVYWFHVFLNW